MIVTIKELDIRLGKRNDMFENPLARAIRRDTKMHQVAVGEIGILIIQSEGDAPEVVEIPADAKEWIDALNRGNEVSARSFDL